MAENVLADAQFGIAKILRPYLGFDALDGSPGSYQGKSALTPVMLTEGGVALDEQAGHLGYSPVLLRGLSVPYGSRVTIWVPLVTPVSETLATAGYIWSVVWRLRNTFDFRQRRIPYHYPRQAAGVPYAGSPRVVIPAASQSVIYNQSEPSTIVQPAIQHSYAEAIQFQYSINLIAPLTPSGAFGAMEQGIVNIPFGPGGEGITTTYQVAELQALGDEMLIGLYRLESYGANWNFTPGQVDAQLSALLGNGSGKIYPDLGVYVLTGSAP